MTYSNTSLNKTFFNDVKRIFNGLECLNPFISMKNRFQKWPFFHRFSTKSPRGYAGAKVLSSMCLRAVKTWGLGRRVSSVAAGHFWAELLPPNVRWAIRIDFRWEWWFNGILGWFNGILWWFNEILGWFNGILGWFNGILGWFNGILWWFNEILGWFNGILWWFNEILGWFNGILWWFNEILWWFNGILWWFNGILWWFNETLGWFNGILGWFNGILWWFNGILWWFNGILWWFNGILWDLMGFNGIYPLVNIHKTMERFTMLLMGKLTI